MGWASWLALLKVIGMVIQFWTEKDKEKRKRHAEAIKKIVEAKESGDAQDLFDAFDGI